MGADNGTERGPIPLKQGSPMPAPKVLLDLYLHLARASEEQNRVLQRDKFLVLAAGIALQAGYPSIAEDCRRRVLEQNPNHLLRNYATMREALASDDIRHYSHQLSRIYPFEKAEYLLDKYRASGYSGRHGYDVLVAEGKPGNGRSAASGATLRDKENRRRRKRRHGLDGNASIRPRLRKALAASDEKRRRRPLPAERAPIPLDDAQPLSALRPVSMPLPSFFGWLIFAFALGIAVCGFALSYLMPSS